MTDKTKTAEHWNHVCLNEIDGHFWLELQSVQERLNRKVSGEPHVNWLEHTLKKHLVGRLPLASCLSLGCGLGKIERRLAEMSAFLVCDGIDIADGVIAQAKILAAEVGYTHINYQVADINALELRENQYDCVWAHNSVHHFTELEHVFAQLQKTIKPDGIFVLHEYVGANHFQFSNQQRQIIQACFELIPPDYRRICQSTNRQSGVQSHRSPTWLAKRTLDKILDGSIISTLKNRFRGVWEAKQGIEGIKFDVNLPTKSAVIAIDPSESVRSSEIVPILERYFEFVEFKPLGGSVLQFLLSDIACNFKDTNGQKLLDMFFFIEDTLIETDILPNDFAYIVARPRNP